jgi:hypothetical protein
MRRNVLGATALAALAVLIVSGVAAAPPALAQVAAPDAIITSEQIAERQAEQALPRQVVPFNPGDFDKYAGYYQLNPTTVFNIHRDGGHFLTRLTRQTDVEIFPESPVKFFATVVHAQISFDMDASGKVTGLVLHQGGQEQYAPRIDEAAAQKIEDDLAARIKAGTPSPGTEAALRFNLESMENGKPDLSNMTPFLAAIAKVQLPTSVPNIQSLGPIKSITFKNVAPNGMDVYDVSFTNGTMEWVVMPLNADGKVSGMGGRRLP